MIRNDTLDTYQLLAENSAYMMICVAWIRRADK